MSEMFECAAVLYIHEYVYSANINIPCVIKFLRLPSMGFNNRIYRIFEII